MSPWLPCALSILAFGACGFDPLPTLEPEGTHYHYVANQVLVPMNNTQAREYGLDLNGDGATDNQFGSVLGLLSTMGLDSQMAMDVAIAEGKIILLVDFQTKDFTNTTAAGIQLLRGENAVPAACNAGETYDPIAKTGCKHHLDGTGSFTIAASAPSNEALLGKIINGTVTAGPGDLSLQITIVGAVINVDLIGARAQTSSISQNGIGSGTSGGVIIGGAITKDDVDNKVIPGMQPQFTVIVARDCTALTAPPTCGCATESTGKTILGLFDAAPADCAVSAEEIKSNSLIASTLSPDVTVNGKPAVSFGIKAFAVPAAVR